MIFAIRKPSNLKGVYTTTDTIKKVKESIKGLNGVSSRVFEDDQLSEAHLWAGVKGSADVKQVSVLAQDREMKETEVFLNVIDSYKLKGYGYFEITFKNREPLGVLLKGAALGRLDYPSYYDEEFTMREKVAYSIQNNFITDIFRPTEFRYIHPMLIFENAYTLDDNEDSKVKNKSLESEISCAINMNEDHILEVRAFSSYSWESEGYDREIYELDYVDQALYREIEKYISKIV